MVVSNLDKIEDKNSVEYQLYVLLNTDKGSVPLLRDFGLDPNIVDKPITIIRMGIFTELYNQIKKYVPGIVLKNVSCDETINGLEIICEVEYE